MQYSLLLVEDDVDLAAHLAQYLQIRGFWVDCAGDGLEARKYLKEKQYDLLLLDIMMPKEDGFTLALHLRSDHPQTPFLFLTARNQKKDVLKGLGLGADDYITKPFDVEELVLRLQNILRRNSPAPEAYKLGSYI